ncbi:MAG: NUDIX domain-containing protein [Actinomycetota bacterium]
MTLDDDSDLIPAATVLLLRDGPETGALEVLMLRRNSKIAFGGAWVFPGGRVDDDEHIVGDSLNSARRAAVREVDEETGLDIATHHLETWSYWVPPQMPAAPTRGPRRRFSTWFFVTAAPDGEVAIDHGEIHEDRWYRPVDALDHHASDEIELVPPTWVTLSQLAEHPTVADALHWATDREPEEFRTRPIAKEPRTVAWAGDVAYDGGSADDPGPRHRLLMIDGGWIYQRT